MILRKLIIAITFGLTVSACSTVDTATRNAPIDLTSLEPNAQIVQRAYDVKDVRFHAPEDLRISEANMYYPLADVVWRGDPIGDRIAQIGDIFSTASDRGTSDMSGNIPVIVEYQLVRFHGVTEKTRFSFGGVYNIVFNMTVRHAETGVIIEGPRLVEANLDAPGGTAALSLEQQGQTEKVRVTDFLTGVLRDELSGAYVI